MKNEQRITVQGDVTLVEEENVRETRFSRQKKTNERVDVHWTDGNQIEDVVKTQMQKNSTEFLARALPIDRQAKAFRVDFDVVEQQKDRDEHENERSEELENRRKNLKGEQIERPVETKGRFVRRRREQNDQRRDEEENEENAN